MKKYLIVYLLLVFTLVSCSQIGLESIPTPDEESALATMVASTVSAALSVTPEATFLEPTSTITLTPEPTATHTPEPTTLHVVYSRAGEIWLWDELEGPRKLSNTGIDANPRISGDGKIVVFARNNQLHAVNADGSNSRVIVSDEYLAQFLPDGEKWIWPEYYDWMLDSHTLYFTTMIECEKCPESSKLQYQFDLHKVDVDTGEVSQILPAGQGGFPYFSPNGKTMALSQKEKINIADVDGTEWKESLSFAAMGTYGQNFYIPSVVPLLDGSGFRVIIPAFSLAISPDGPEESFLWEISKTREPIQLHSFVQISYYPAPKTLSMDGDLLAFALKDVNGVFSICLFDLVIGQEVCTPRPEEEGRPLSIAPDGSKYNFFAVDTILVDEEYVYDTKYYIQSTDDNNPPTLVEGWTWFEWVTPNQYLYIDEDLDLRLATLGGSDTYIHNGIKLTGSEKTNDFPFDFSQR